MISDFPYDKKEIRTQNIGDIISFLPDATFAIDIKGRVIAWNRAIERMTGVKAQDIIGKDNYEYAIPFYASRRPILIDLVLNCDERFISKYSSFSRDGDAVLVDVFIPSFGKGGAYLWAKASPLYDSLGNIVGAIESIRDITDRKMAEEKICSMKRRLSQVIDFLPDATFVIDLEGIVIAWNRAMERMTGVSAEEIVGKGDYEYAIPFYGCRRPILADLVLRPNEESEKEYENLELDGQNLVGEIFIPTFGNGGSHIWAKATPLYDIDGRISGAIESIRDITELKRAMEEIKAAKTRMSDVIDFLPDATFVIDTSGKVVAWNKAIEKMTGVKAADMIGRGDYEHSIPFYGCRRPIMADLVIRPDFNWEAKYEALNADGKNLVGEIFIPTFGKDGAYIWSKATPLCDANGQITGAIEAIRDITEKKKALEALKGSEQEKTAILEGLKGVAVEFLDRQMRIIWINDAVLKRLGMKIDQVKGQFCYNLIQGIDAPCTGCTAVETLRSGNPTEGEVTTPDGKSWASRSNPIRASDGTMVGVVHVAMNITHRKLAEEKIKSINQQLSEVIEFLPDSTFVINMRGVVIAWNKAMERMTGIKSEDMIGKGDYEYAIPFYGMKRPILIDLVLMGDQLPKSIYKNLQRDGDSLFVDTFVQALGPKGRFLWAKASPLYDSSGKIVGAIEAIRDVTERKLTEERLERSRSELRIASDIQRSFLPEKVPTLQGFDLAAISIPAMEVGGDFYDFISGPDGSLGVVIADVSGKSIPAALFMALSRTIVRVNATHHERGIEIIRDANDTISEDSRAGMFVTLFYGVLNQAKKTLVYANAGHPPPLLLRAGSNECTALDVTGIAIGAMPGAEYEERSVDLSNGDVLILYTDGITEAINSKDEQYGIDRLCSIVKESRSFSAREIMRRILREVSDFTDEQPQFDDITMIIAKVET